MDRSYPESKAMGRSASSDMSIVSWLAQRLTGVLLVVFLLAHLVVAHFVAVGPETGQWSASEVASRLVSGWYRTLDVGLLAFALFHGIHGALRVIVSAGHVRGRTYFVLLGLAWAVGIGLMYFGLVVFAALMG
jgi:succinate dehydrogenase / fumarate reductase membrane anchor subunit